MDGPEKRRILRLHVEDDIALTTLAQDTGLCLRTLQRWHQQYKTGGIAALESQTRHDSGSRRVPILNSKRSSNDSASRAHARALLLSTASRLKRRNE